MHAASVSTKVLLLCAPDSRQNLTSKGRIPGKVSVERLAVDACPALSFVLVCKTSIATLPEHLEHTSSHPSFPSTGHDSVFDTLQAFGTKQVNDQSPTARPKVFGYFVASCNFSPLGVRHHVSHLRLPLLSFTTTFQHNVCIFLGPDPGRHSAGRCHCP